MKEERERKGNDIRRKNKNVKEKESKRFESKKEENALRKIKASQQPAWKNMKNAECFEREAINLKGR